MISRTTVAHRLQVWCPKICRTGPLGLIARLHHWTMVCRVQWSSQSRWNWQIAGIRACGPQQKRSSSSGCVLVSAGDFRISGLLPGHTWVLSTQCRTVPWTTMDLVFLREFLDNPRTELSPSLHYIYQEGLNKPDEASYQSPITFATRVL